MESTSFATSAANNQLLFVCHYITTLGIILNNNNLLSSQVENDTVPVLNAFFEYLNKSMTNESLAKIHLFNEIGKKIPAFDYEERMNNSANIDKLFEYIINVALFAHYGGIKGYVRNILDNKSESFSKQQEILFHHFEKNFIIKNMCSLRKESANLTSLAIDGIFRKYVLPVFTELWRNLISPMYDSRKVQRSRRQISSSEENNAEMDDETSARNYRIEFLSPIIQQGLNILDEDRDMFTLMMRNIAYERRNDENYSLQLWRLEITTNAIAHYLISLKGSTFFFSDFKLLINYPEGGAIQRALDSSSTMVDKIFVHYNIISESFYGFVNLNEFNMNNLFLVFPGVEFTITHTDLRNLENRSCLFINLRRNHLSYDNWLDLIDKTKDVKLSNVRNSRRMNAIERVAKFIWSRLPITTFIDVVNMLKDYILSVDSSNYNLPTYDDLAHDFLKHLRFLNVYSSWKIKNNNCTNNLLYEAKIFSFNDYNDNIKVLRKYYFRSIKAKHFYSFYSMYQEDSDIFQEKITLEDFIEINNRVSKKPFFYTSNFKLAIFRVALRQCDEEEIEEPLVLYQAFDTVNSVMNIRKFTGDIMTLKVSTPCSKYREHLLTDVLNKANTTRAIVFYKIHIKNHCGVADVYQFTKNKIKSHFLTISQKYKRIGMRTETINNIRVNFITLEENETTLKENRMVSLLKELNM